MAANDDRFVSNINELKSLFERRTKLRQDSIKRLKLGLPGLVNLDLITHFGPTFGLEKNNIDSDMSICKAVFTDPTIKIKDMGVKAGKVGQVSLVELPYPGWSNLILKKIGNTPPPRKGGINVITRRLNNIEGNRMMNQSLDQWRLKDKQKKEDRYAVIESPTDYINQTFINLILNIILGDHPNYVHQYDSFWCGNDGYNLMEVADGGTLATYIQIYGFNDDIGHDIFSQILGPLSILKSSEYSFVHGDLKPLNIFVKGKEEKVIFKLGDFDKSSITFSGIRFYNYTRDYSLTSKPFPIKEIDGEDWYQLTSTYPIPLQVYTMHSSYGFFSSYDIYTLFLTCLSISSFRDYIMKERLLDKPGRRNSDTFYSIFKDLFYSDELHILIDYLEKYDGYSNIHSMTYVNTIITTLKLHFRLNVDFVYEYFGIKPPKVLTETHELSFLKASDGRICLSDCSRNGNLSTTKNTCQTTPYISGKYTWSKLYDWSYCKN